MGSDSNELAQYLSTRRASVTPSDVGLPVHGRRQVRGLRREEVACAIVGASRPEQVEDNAAASGVELDDATLRAIDDAVAPVVAA